MDSSRRHILQLLGFSSLALAAKPDFNALAVEGKAEKAKPVLKENDNALKAKQWAMVIDTRKFHSEKDLEPLIEVCHKIHNVPHLTNQRHEIKWLWDTHYHNAFPGKAAQFMSEEVEHKPFLVLCNHCENPPCVRACPTNSTWKRESDGVVLMDFHRCIGCRFCMAACPFGARSFNYRDPRPFIRHLNTEFPTRAKGVVEKCNFCAERLAVGKLPACVEASEGRLAFGDLYDANSTVRELIKTNFTIRRKQSLGTEPSVYYIV
ncbi:4Fe-4S ferredoxin [Alkalispirochaeta odontotermitis]|nr:4Fe-4S ferredoxin [Alkalispirochaeta odontotermitis]CAB1076951.1 Sulfite reduction-associated complex DsrMKJOP iron-sulfur protein DsrO (=HmeA) [Olavius algarvensis Delta 1 endosymbiont]